MVILCVIKCGYREIQRRMIMKNKFLSILLAMCLLLPAGLYLTACGKDDDDDKEPAPPTNLEILNKALDDLDDILDNATLTITPEAKVTVALLKKYGGEDYAISYKLADGREEISLPEVYEGGGKLYMDEYGNSYNKGNEQFSPIEATATKGYEDLEGGLIDISELEETIEDISDKAHFYQSNPIKIVTEDSKKHISLDLDLGTRINNSLLVNYRTNHAKPLAVFINTLLSDLSQKDIDIVEIVDNFAITVTDNTTLLDFVDYLALEMGTTTTDLVDDINEYIKLYNYTTGLSSDTVYTQIAEDNGDELTAAKRETLQLLDVSELDEYPILASLNETGYFTEEVTGVSLSRLFASMVEDEETAFTIDDIAEGSEDLTAYLQYLESTTINMLGINTKIYLDTNGKPERVLFSAVGNGTAYYEEQDGYIPVDLNATCDIVISNVGTTSVTLPTSSTIDKYYIQIALPESTFNLDTYTTTLNAAILPNSFSIVLDDVTYASFNKNTKQLVVNLKLIRELIDDYYRDTTYQEKDSYVLFDDNISSISVITK